MTKHVLKLERFSQVPFGAVVLALPALTVCGLWEHASDLFPAWIDRTFAEIALFRIASLVLSKPTNSETTEHAWPADWSKVLCEARLPHNGSLFDLINLIGRDSIRTAMWQGVLAAKWVSDASRLKAVLGVQGQHSVLLEAPAIASGIDRARNSLLAYGLVEPWFQVLDALPMLLLPQVPSEDIHSAWKQWILPQLQNVLRGRVRPPASSPARRSHRLTVVLNKGGVDLRLFRRLLRDGFHVFSYRFSADGLWPKWNFTEQEVEVQPGQCEPVRTAERQLAMADGLPLREVRCVCRNGLEFSVVSSDRELELHRIGAKIALQFTSSRFLDRLQNSVAVVRSYGAQQGASGGTAGCKLGTVIGSFLSGTVLVVSRAEAILEQILRENLLRPRESPLVLRQILCERVDLVPAPGANILRVLVHTKGDVGEQAVVGHLCSQLTATEASFPGTNLRLVYELVPHE